MLNRQQNQYKVSVIVPVYKVEKYLPRCIESLRAQTLKDIEIILVDDGSPDGCPAICDKYALLDERIRVLHKPNGGVLLARQSGLELASAPYIGFLDSDDFASIDMFETLWREAVRSKAQVVCCSMIHYWNEKKQYKDTRACSLTGVYESDDLFDFYRRFFFDNTPRAEKESVAPALWNKLFDRDLIFDCHRKLTQECSDIVIGEDMLIAYSCLLKAKCVSVLGNYCPVYYVYRADSVMNSFKKNLLENTELLLKALDQMEMPGAAAAPVKEAIRRYASYTAAHIVLGVVPEGTGFAQKIRQTVKIVDHLLSSPLWKDKFCEDGSDLFAYGFEKLIYRMLKKGMGISIALLDLIHEFIKKHKKKAGIR